MLLSFLITVKILNSLFIIYLTIISRSGDTFEMATNFFPSHVSFFVECVSSKDCGVFNDCQGSFFVLVDVLVYSPD